MEVSRIFNFSYYCTMGNKFSLKYIKSLQLKKYRQEEQSFCVEGTKSVLEALNSPLQVKLIAGTKDFFNQHQHTLQNNEEQLILGEKDLSKISSLKNNNTVLAVVAMPENLEFGIENEWVIAIDSVNDPGNLGTILRIADWYGIHKVICSNTTVELYNPKVISSSMGSFTRVKSYYTDLQSFLSKQKAPILGTYLKGNSVHDYEFEKTGILLMGSESHGISSELEGLVTQKVTIPSGGAAESLNVAIATAIVLDNLHRSTNKPIE